MMAYSHSAANMIELLKENFPSGDMRILESMRNIPRDKFVGPGFVHLAYENCTVPIGDDQTLSKPLTVYKCLSMVNLNGAEHLLEIGSGTGYLAAVASRVCDRVTGIENKLKLANESRTRIRNLGIHNVTIIYADGNSGYDKNAPYDVIVFSAVCSELPEAVTAQIREGGLIGAPVRKGENQVFRIWRKTDGVLEFTGDEFDCRFVPLTGKTS